MKEQKLNKTKNIIRTETQEYIEAYETLLDNIFYVKNVLKIKYEDLAILLSIANDRLSYIVNGKIWTSLKLSKINEYNLIINKLKNERNTSENV